jgi:SAM-dependent methyltransferase
MPNHSRLIQGDVNAAPFAKGEFDVAIAHTVLMHLPEPRRAVAEMICVTRDGGLVIAREVSRNAINAMIHVHETDEQEQIPPAIFQAMNANIRRRTGVDHNIGMKMPVLMHQAGLVDVQARISDAVRTVFPLLDTPEMERIFSAICDDNLGAYPTDDESFRRAVASMTALGLAEAEAAAELRREMNNAYRTRGCDYHFVQPGLISISFGTKNR